MRGRIPKPSALKAIAGNPGKRKLNSNEAKFDGVPSCPSHLDTEAKKEWRRISKELASVGLLTRADRAALAAYCIAYSRWVRAEMELQKLANGDNLKTLLTVAAKSKFPVVHPLIGISNSAAKLMKEYLIEFGLTPASRSRLNVPGSPTSADPFIEFMQSMGAENMNESSEVQR